MGNVGFMNCILRKTPGQWLYETGWMKWEARNVSSSSTAVPSGEKPERNMRDCLFEARSPHLSSNS